MSDQVATAILEIKTDISGVSKGLDDLKKLVEKNAQEVRKRGKEMADSMSAFGSAAEKAGKVLAGAFTVTAIVAAGKQVIDYAGQVTDLSKRLGVSTTTVQQWQATFGKSGVAIETVAKASGELQNKLIGGDKSALAALQKMGVSLEQLKTLSPEEQFTKVADAVGNLQNKGEQIYASKTLFGKSGEELLSALDGNLQKNIDSLAEMGVVIDEQTIAAADDFGDRMGLMSQKLIAMTATIVGPLLPALNKLADGLMWIGDNVIGPIAKVAIPNLVAAFDLIWSNIAGFLAKIIELGQRVPLIGKYLDGLSGAQQWLREQSEKSTQRLKDWASGIDRSGESAKKATPAVAGLAIGLGGELTEAQKKYAAALENVLSFSDRWYSVLETIDGRVVEAAKYYLELGASVEDVQTVYGLTKGQIDAVVASMKLEKTMVDAAGASYAQLSQYLERVAEQRRSSSNAGFSKNLEAMLEADKSATDLRDQRSLTSYEYQVSLIQRESDDKKRALDKNGANYDAAMAAIENETRVKMGQAAQDWQNALAEMEASSGTFGKTLIARLQGIPALIQQALTGGGGFGGAFQAILSGLGSDIGTEAFAGIARNLSSTFASTFGSRATELLGSIIPGLGGVIGSLAGPLIQKLMSIGGPSQQELAGRKLEETFQKQFASFDDMVTKIGAAYAATGKTFEQARADVQALMDAERQGGDAVQGVIDKIKEAMDAAAEQAALLSEASSLYGPSDADLDAAVVKAKKIFDAMDASGQYSQEQLNNAYYAWQKAMADAGDSAAQAWIDMQAGVTKASSAAQSAIDDMIKTRDALAATYANEAPEEEAGSIETAARASVDAINKQIADQQAAMAAAAETQGGLIAGVAQEGERVFSDAAGGITDALTASAKDSAGAFSKAFKDLDLTVKVKVDWDTGGGPPGASRPPDVPGYGEPQTARFTRPTLIWVGEKGPEDAIFSGGGRSFDRSPASSPAGMSASGIESRLDQLNLRMGQMISDLPKQIARAVNVQMQMA